MFRKALSSLVNRPKSQLPALDVLRSIAVLLVIFGHQGHSYESIATPTWFTHSRLVRSGFYGVDLFFVLSGYLIGVQLWRELLERQTVDVRTFVIRRGLRIWPLFYFFYVVLILLGFTGQASQYGWSDLIYLTNYVNRGIVMGSWSLCIEEQFYLLAPLGLLIGAQSNAPLSRYRIALGCGFLLLPAIRALTWMLSADDFWVHDPDLYKTLIYTPLHTHCDGILIGLVIANIRMDKSTANFRRLLKRWWLLPLAIAVAALLFKLQQTVFAFTAVNLVFGTVVFLALETQVAEWRMWKSLPFYWISRLSFGMYLNHEYFLDFVSNVFQQWVPVAYIGAGLHSLLAAVALVLLSASIALVTYCLIEYPPLYWRDRWLAQQKRANLRPTMASAQL